MLAARRQGAACIVATRLCDGRQHLLAGAPPPTCSLAAAVHATLAAGRSRQVVVDEEAWFLHLHAPPPRLIVVGAGQIAQCLVGIARVLGCGVVVCDPRQGYASAARFADTTLRHEWPDAAVRAEQPGCNDAVLALAHDPKLDDPALLAALHTPCGYIGALGSRATHAARLARLAADGADTAALQRIMGPVGLDIGAIGAGEIALSIVAEWIARRRGAPARDRAA